MSLQHNEIAVVLVEPQALMREALTALLKGHALIRIVAAASHAREVPSIVQRSPVDVVLLALEPEDLDLEAALGESVNCLPHPGRTLVLTSQANSAFQVRVIELGAMGVVFKDQSGEVLGKAIKRVHDGELWLDRARLTTVVTSLVARRNHGHDEETVKVESLTVREREVIALVAEGLTNTTIGERLFISPITVRNHLTSILSKLGVTDRFQLAVYAFRRGLVLCPATEEMRRMAVTMKNRPIRHEPSHVAARRSQG